MKRFSRSSLPSIPTTIRLPGNLQVSIVPPPPVKRWGLRILTVIACFTLSLSFHLGTPLANRVVRQLIGSVGSEAIQGAISVGRIDSLSLSGATVGRLTVWDAQGVKILTVGNARLRVRPWALYKALLVGRITLHDIEAWDIDLLLRPDAEGDPTLFTVFNAQTPSPVKKKKPRIEIIKIRLHQGRVHGSFLGLENFVLTKVDARGGMRLQEDLEIDVHQAKGLFEKPFPWIGSADWVSGTVSTVKETGISLRGKLSRHDGRAPEHARWSLRLQRPKHERISHILLKVDAQPVSPETLSGIGYTWADGLTSLMRGQVTLKGPLDKLRLDAAVQTDGGNLALSGTIHRGDAFVLHANSTHMKLERVIRRFPEIHVSAHARLTVPLGDDTTRRSTVSAEMEPVVSGTFGTLALPALSAKAILYDDRIDVTELESIHIPGGLRARLTAYYAGPATGHISAKIPEIQQDRNIRRWFPEASGSIQTDINWSMNLVTRDRFAIHGELHSDQLHYGFLRAEALTVKGSLQGEPTRPQANVHVRGFGMVLGSYTLGDADFDLLGGPTQYTTHGIVFAPNERSLNFNATVRAGRNHFDLEASEIAFRVREKLWIGHVGAFHWVPGADIKLDDFELVTIDGHQRLHVDWHLQQTRSEVLLDANLKHYDLEALDALLGEPTPWPIKGFADAKLKLQGKVSDPRIDFTGTLYDSGYRNLQNVSGDASVKYGAGHVFIQHHIAVNHRGQRSTVDGTIDGEPGSKRRMTLSQLVQLGRDGLDQLNWSGDWQVENIDVRFYDDISEEAPRPWTGVISGKFGLRGKLSRPQVLFDARGVNMSLASSTPLEVYAAGIHQDEQMVLTAFELRDAIGLWLQATVHLPLGIDDLTRPPTDWIPTLAHKPWRFTLSMPDRLTDYWPQPFRDMLADKAYLRGQVSLETVLQHAEEVNSLSGTVRMKSIWQPEKAKRRSQTGYLKPELACRLEQQPEIIFDADIQQGIGTFKATGSISDEAQRRLFGKAKGSVRLPLQTWLGHATWVPPPTDLEARLEHIKADQMPWACRVASGLIDANVNVRDLFTDAPLVDASVTARELILRTIKDGVVSESAPFVFTARAKTPSDAFSTTQPRGQSKLNLSAVLSRPERLPQTSRCASARREDALGPPRVTRCGDVVASGIRPACVRAELPILTHDGLISIDAQREVMAHMDLYQTSLEPFMVYLPSLHKADGIATGYIKARGIGDAIKWSGQLSVENACVDVVGLGSELQNIRARFRFENQSAFISKDVPFQTYDGKGFLKGYGRIDFVGWMPSFLDLHLVSGAFPLRNEGIELASLTGSSQVAARIGNDRTEAKFTEDDLLIELPVESTNTTQSLDRHPDIVVQDAAPDDELEQDLNRPIRIMVDARDPFTIRRNDFNIKASGVIDTYYEPGIFTVKGYIELREGFFEVFGKRLRVQRGSLNFDGGIEVNPRVDLQAVYGRPGDQSDQIIVTVSGRLNNPVIEFSSTNPALTSRAEIISVLMSGRRDAFQQTRQTAGDDQAIGQQTTAFLNSLAGGVMAIANRQLGGVVPSVSFQSGRSAEQNQGIAQSSIFKVGLQLDSLFERELSFMRPIVQGAYVEGFTSTSGASQTGATSSALAGGGSGRWLAGGSLELYFPGNVVGTILLAPTASTWGVDVTWQP